MPQIHANGVNLEYETFGNPAHPPILLIMGLGAQLLLWPEEFCQALADAGHYVIRYDNRDVGLSSKITDAGRTRLMRAAIASTFKLPVRAPYTLDDMAHDALGLMDGLKLDKAHVVGASMGGMIAQILAAKHPKRISSLTLIMTSSGNPRLPGPSLKIKLRLVKRPPLLDRESLIRYSMDTWRMIGSPDYPTEESALRQKVERSYDRSLYPAGLARQTLAVIASGSRVPLLRHIVAPTLVIHGDSDPLVPVACGRDVARHIPHARLEIIKGMGHDMPPVPLQRITQLILDHARTATSASVMHQGSGTKAPGKGEGRPVLA
jgi:pimeloyl-ACP methyl ester carboxylesterase